MSRQNPYTRFTFLCPPELVAAVQELSRRTRVPQGAFVREGLAVVVKKYAAMLGDKTPAAIDEYVEPAHLNAHNAIAWSDGPRAHPLRDAGLPADGESVPPPAADQ